MAFFVVHLIDQVGLGIVIVHPRLYTIRWDSESHCLPNERSNRSGQPPCMGLILNLVQERGLEPPTGMRIYSAGRYQLRCYSCDVTVCDVSSPIGLIRQAAFVFAITIFGFRFAIVEHLCGVELAAMFGNIVIFHYCIPFILVGLTGFEPVISRLSVECITAML